MKRLIAFAAFALLHVLGWVGTHAWLTANPKTALVVADTSFSMKDEFPAMRRWIDEHVDGLRYTRVLVGTDKALIGPLDELRSTEAIFRTSFGRSDAESLKRYGVVEADTRTLLSDGSFDAPGWDTVTFGDAR